MGMPNAFGLLNAGVILYRARERVFGFFAHFLLHSAARVTASLHSPPEQPVYKQDGAGRSLDEWWSEAVVRWLESLW